jgi:DNA topoisomerase I
VTARTEGLETEYLHRQGNKDKGFVYVYPDGSRLTDEAQLQRIAKLAVPPGYDDVYVAPDADAELQAFGRDAKGRLQYRYHADFVRGNQNEKWSRLIRFATALPTLRERTAVDLRGSGLSDARVMALMTRLLYVARFRVGSDAYARENKTYGLTTLRKRHVRLSGNTVEFNFKGKHSVQQHKATTDKTIATHIAKLLELPGPWLWQCELEGGRQRVTSSALNAYIRDAMGAFSAKDFRTWGGTLLAAEFLADIGASQSDKQARRNLNDCVRAVAEDLENTPAVVRAHYVSPGVFDRYLDGQILDDFEPKPSRTKANDATGLTRSEIALKRLLETSRRWDARAAKTGS